jgi:hypothetical protein
MNKIKFCISSHISFYEKTYPILISSLLKSGVPSCDIYFFIGGCESYNKIEDPNGINIYEVNHNSIDFTSLISVMELNIYSPYWFLLHDTTYVGSNFYKNILNYDYENKPAVALTYEIGMNIGAYGWELLNNNLEKLLNFKNTDYSEESVQYYKKIGVPYEDWLLNEYRHYHYCKDPRETIYDVDLYKTNIPRIIEVFKEIDLYKVKANWSRKENYQTKL